jgi:hypothetical protein
MTEKHLEKCSGGRMTALEEEVLLPEGDAVSVLECAALVLPDAKGIAHLVPTSPRHHAVHTIAVNVEMTVLSPGGRLIDEITLAALLVRTSSAL